MKILTIIFFLALSFTCLFTQTELADEKKLEFEFTFGFSLSKPSQLYQRGKGIETLITQYAKIQNLTVTTTGDFKENTIGFPIVFAINYNLNPKWFLKGGVEYHFSGNTSEKIFRLAQNNNQVEDQTHNLENRISYLMPFIGGGLRVSAFTVYVSLGLGFTHLTLTHIFNYSAETYTQEIKHIFNTNGIAPGFLLGVQYKIKMGGKFHLFTKLEFLYMNAASLKGEKESITSNSGDPFTKSIKEEGTLYSYDMNPYGLGNYPYWDLHSSSPNSSWIKNSQKMNLNLSCIRILFGFAF